MSGLLLAGVSTIWLIVVVSFARWITRRSTSLVLKIVSALVVFPVMLIAPLADELIGKRQFESLCRQYAVQWIDEKHAMNRRIIYVSRGIDQYASNTAIKIRIDPVVYMDAETSQVLVSYHTLHANGGWLIRSLGISETGAPLFI